MLPFEPMDLADRLSRATEDHERDFLAYLASDASSQLKDTEDTRESQGDT